MALGIPFTNLTNVFFDKTSGELILRDISIETGTLSLIGFVHVQAVASTTWTVVHDLDTENFSGVHVIEDTTNDQIFPDNVKVVDVNTITISFNAAMSGRAMLVLFL